MKVYAHMYERGARKFHGSIEPIKQPLNRQGTFLTLIRIYEWGTALRTGTGVSDA